MKIWIPDIAIFGCFWQFRGFCALRLTLLDARPYNQKK
jgi:hypothetical protein